MILLVPMILPVLYCKPCMIFNMWCSYTIAVRLTAVFAALALPLRTNNTGAAMSSMTALFAWCKSLTCRASKHLIGLSLVLHDAACVWHTILVHLREQAAALYWFMAELRVVAYVLDMGWNACLKVKWCNCSMRLRSACHVSACYVSNVLHRADAEGPLEYQCFFTADVCNCVTCKFVLPTRALHTQ